MSERGSKTAGDESGIILGSLLKRVGIDGIKIKIAVNINRNPDNKDIMFNIKELLKDEGNDKDIRKIFNNFRIIIKKENFDIIMGEYI